MKPTTSLLLVPHLVDQSTRAFKNLMKQVNSTTQEQAFQFRDARWPDHPYGIGQDGSIAGIVYHVAAWKQLTLPIFKEHGTPESRTDFRTENAPDIDDWPAIVAWLEEIGSHWLQQLEALTESQFLEPRTWEGVTITIADYVIEMTQHDIQHASQIEYLLQKLTLDSF